MFRRQIRSILPIISTPLPKKLCKTKDETSKGQDLQELKADDIVRFRKDGTWSRKGMVIDKISQPRSYKDKDRQRNNHQKKQTSLAIDQGAV